MLLYVDKSKHFSINQFFFVMFLLFDDYHMSTPKSTRVSLLMSDIIILLSDVYILLG